MTIEKSQSISFYRDNITFGDTFEEHRYYRVLYACALNHDINMMTAQDMTEVVTAGIFRESSEILNNPDVYDRIITTVYNFSSYVHSVTKITYIGFNN